MDIERRNFAVDELRVMRASDKSPRIVGHAAVFDSMSENLGGFREIIKPGAFAKAVEQDDVRALWNHNPDHVLGRNRAGTLSLREDDTGLAVDIDAPDTQVARDLMLSIERGDVSEMSFGFRVRAGGSSWDEDENGEIIRTLTDVSLFDVSPVTYPAYPETDAAVRDMRQWKAAELGEREVIAADIGRRLLRLDLIEKEF
ncbi:MAG: HK97 family phage prohead protease [Woeseiaceae bacterium]